MEAEVSIKEDLKSTFRSVLKNIVEDQDQHARFLNTLSYMEHIGATKIARTQSGPSSTFMSLKHAAEEARHAFYLKKLSQKLSPEANPDYSFPYLMAPVSSRQYLYRLDTGISRILKDAGYSGKAMRDLAYLLVTYAIEVRADSLYPVYQEFLEDYPVKLSVRTIINEEIGHLEEMEAALSKYPNGAKELIGRAVSLESTLFENWVMDLKGETVPNG